MHSVLKGSRVLITGGTGSFGHGAMQAFLKQRVKEVIILSRDEKKQYDMRCQYPDSPITFIIGDVRNAQSVDLATRKVDYVFHAAALKQVPSCEFFPMETVATNVIGTENVLKSAQDNNVKKVVILSTDKAVYPINVMGLTKALSEKIMLSHARNSLSTGNKTIVCATRYGNVMATRGSVIPLFLSQIRNNQPITITDPDMTRFMLSLPEAIDLVLFAMADAKGGEIYVRKSPASTINNIAQTLKDTLRSKSEIKIIGERLGEKKHETLVSAEEMSRTKNFRNYYRINLDTKELAYEKYFEKGDKKNNPKEAFTSENTRRLDYAETKKLIKSLPEVKAAER